MRRRHLRRNAPLTDSQVSALKGILAAHGTACNPKRRSAKRRRISAAHRRKLLANLRKARAAKRRSGRRVRRVVRRSRR